MSAVVCASKSMTEPGMALLTSLRETADSPEPIDVIAQVSEKTGIGEPNVQNALFAMEAAQEIRYERNRYLVNEGTPDAS